MIPIYSKSGQEMMNHFEKLVNWYGRKDFIPVFLENNIFNFYLNREVKSTETNRSLLHEELSAVGKRGWQSSALVSPTKTLNRNEAPSVMTSNQLENLVQMSKWETKKMRKPWKQKFPESE